MQVYKVYIGLSRVTRQNNKLAGPKYDTKARKPKPNPGIVSEDWERAVIAHFKSLKLTMHWIATH
jgi:hypothetical protein